MLVSLLPNTLLKTVSKNVIVNTNLSRIMLVQDCGIMKKHEKTNNKKKQMHIFISQLKSLYYVWIVMCNTNF